MPTQSYDFFKNIQTFSNENDIFNEKFYHPLPDDWSVIVTDIKNSTIAIENGFYKDVNVLGVASIIAVKNACKNIEISFLEFDDLSKNTDQIKFDSTFRTILDVTPHQRAQILQYLTELHIQNKITFGYHVANSALLTCFVRSKDNDHFHFIDGNHGGYTLAAKNLKFMIAKSNSSTAA